jgi:hypothetical protein
MWSGAPFLDFRSGLPDFQRARFLIRLCLNGLRTETYHGCVPAINAEW